jgi:PAS domain S-box-containing protein
VRKERGRPLRILSVEDDPEDTGLIQDLFETEGIVCEITRADTQASLLDLLKQDGVDLILADYSLPSFDGISALKLAIQVCPNVPFIFVSGTLGEEVAIEALKLGATDYVLKTSLSRLVPSVQRALREATQKAERRRAEEALRQSETYLAEAQRLSHTGSFGWKPSTGEIIWSEETFRIFQYDRTTTPTLELILRRVHPEDAALVQQTVERATQYEKDFDHEYRLMMPDGSLKHLHVVARALNDEGTVEFVGAVMDVTERKRVAEALLRSEAYLAEGQKLSHTGTWACNLASREMIHSSEEHRNLFGLAAEGAGIPPFEEFYQRIHPDDRGPTVGDLERAMAAGTDIEAHFRVVLPEGTTRYMYGTGHPLVKPSGGPGEFVGTVMDVTAAKLAEQTLRESEAYLAEAQRLSHTGSWARVYATGEMRYFSEECYRVLGFEPLGGLPRFETFLQRVHPDDQGKVRGITESAGREKVEYELDYRIVHPAGEIRDVHVVAHPVFNPSGDLVEFVGSVMDITERKQAEEALRQAHADLARINRVTTMGELTASLAHEVNQPIAAAATDANTCLRWLARDQPDLEEARAAASRVVKDAARASEIMSRIRSLFKKEISQRESVDVNEIIRGMVELLRGEATRYSISVRTELSEDLPQIIGDRVQLQQVTMNLIINSIDAMKDVEGKRDIAITSQRAENEQLQVSVSDTGIGLPSQRADQIFNAFFTTKPHGTGMGLRISRSIVESHGGRLWAAPNSPRGARFAFTLPTKMEGRE